MSFFAGTVAAMAEGKTVFVAFLGEHEFEDGISYNWTGNGNLELDGHTWVGKGDLVSFGSMPFTADDAAALLTITLSGVEPQYVAEARSLPPVRGNSQRIWLQFFDLETLQPVALDGKYLIADRVMDTMTWGGVGPSERRVSVTSEDVWADRNTAEFANWSDSDQQALFPGDRGLEFVNEYVPGYRVTWPNFP